MEKKYANITSYTIVGRYILSPPYSSRFDMGHASHIRRAFTCKLAVKEACKGKGSSVGNETHTL